MIQHTDTEPVSIDPNAVFLSQVQYQLPKSMMQTLTNIHAVASEKLLV